MKTVAVFEAKSRLSEILTAVEHGEEYTVTKADLMLTKKADIVAERASA